MSDVLDWPEALNPESMQWGPEHNTKLFESVFNKSGQTRAYPGARWRCQMTFGTLFPDEERRLTTFLNRLNGRAGRFRLPDFYRRAPVSRGDAVVDGDGQTGGILNTRGWLPSRRVLAIGDYVTVNDELKEVLEDVWSDAGGLATLRIGPWLRWPPPSGTTVNHTTPYAIMRLDDDANPASRQRRLSNLSISCTEAI